MSESQQKNQQEIILEYLKQLKKELHDIQLEYIKEFFQKFPDTKINIDGLRFYLENKIELSNLQEEIKSYEKFLPWNNPPLILELDKSKKYLKLNKDKSKELLENYSKKYWEENINPNDDRFIKKEIVEIYIPGVDNDINNQPFIDNSQFNSDQDNPNLSQTIPKTNAPTKPKKLSKKAQKEAKEKAEKAAQEKLDQELDDLMTKLDSNLEDEEE